MQAEEETNVAVMGKNSGRRVGSEAGRSLSELFRATLELFLVRCPSRHSHCGRSVERIIGPKSGEMEVKLGALVGMWNGVGQG